MILNKLPNLRSRTVIRKVSCQTSNSTFSLLMHSAWEATEIGSAYFTEEKTIALLSSMLSCELLRSKLDFFPPNAVSKCCQNPDLRIFTAVDDV